MHVPVLPQRLRAGARFSRSRLVPHSTAGREGLLGEAVPARAKCPKAAQLGRPWAPPGSPPQGPHWRSPPQPGMTFLGCSTPLRPQTPKEQRDVDGPVCDYGRVSFAPSSLDKCHVRQPLSQSRNPCDPR